MIILNNDKLLIKKNIKWVIHNKLLQLESILVAESTLSWQRNRRWILHEQKIKCFKPIFSRTFILPLRRVSSSLPVSSSGKSTQKWRVGFQDTRSTMMTSIMAMTLMMVMTLMMISMMVMTDSGDDNRINQRTTYLQSDIFTQSCPAFKRGRRVEGMEISGDDHFFLLQNCDKLDFRWQPYLSQNCNR